MATKPKTLNDLFLHTLKDIYYAEKQIYRTLPKMAKAADSEELKKALELHREQTEGQIGRLEDAFKAIEKRAQGVPCEAIQGILEEGKEVMEDFGESDVIDAGLIAGAQAVEHYEIARYGALKTWAAQLDLPEVASLLDQTLQEEKETDKILSELAEKLNTKGKTGEQNAAPKSQRKSPEMAAAK